MDQRNLMEYFIELAKEHYPDGFDKVILPPPVFIAMNAEFIKIDQKNSMIEVKFPIPESSLNPFGSMQGGIIAAAVDNAVGPLSMLVGPINFTRDMSLKYRKPVSKDFEYIIVKAALTEKKGRRLFFSAEVMDPEGNLLVSAKLMNWIVG
ncbi:MAG: PaaI family thioesterase, partial [Spirochaetota bacterium]|nr:PaaI family thioesterase [Spirochaetota bacterium]